LLIRKTGQKNGLDLVNLANEMLNKAKESGGNRVFSILDMKGPLKKTQEKIFKVTGSEP